MNMPDNSLFSILTTGGQIPPLNNAVTPGNASGTHDFAAQFWSQLNLLNSAGTPNAELTSANLNALQTWVSSANADPETEIEPLPTDLQNFAALFGKRLPAAHPENGAIDLQATMKALAGVMQQLRQLESDEPAAASETNVSTLTTDVSTPTTDTNASSDDTVLYPSIRLSEVQGTITAPETAAAPANGNVAPVNYQVNLPEPVATDLPPPELKAAVEQNPNSKVQASNHFEPISADSPTRPIPQANGTDNLMRPTHRAKPGVIETKATQSPELATMPTDTVLNPDTPEIDPLADTGLPAARQHRMSAQASDQEHSDEMATAAVTPSLPTAAPPVVSQPESPEISASIIAGTSANRLKQADLPTTPEKPSAPLLNGDTQPPKTPQHLAGNVESTRQEFAAANPFKAAQRLPDGSKTPAESGQNELEHSLALAWNTDNQTEFAKQTFDGNRQNPQPDLTSNPQLDGSPNTEPNPSSRAAQDIFRLNQALPNNSAPVSAKPETLSMNRPFGDAAWNQELGNKVIWMNTQGVPSAELRLNPENLGPIHIKVDVSQDQATVSFTAQHAAVKEAIENAIPKLRDMFSGQQLNLVDVNVSQQQSDQRQTNREFLHMGAESDARHSRQQQEEEPMQNPAQSLVDEIEAGRAVASNGLLSIFA
ncbi:flagellar hook-length control protein FliK [Methylomonas sp. HYX-M1]|uniref:flagellar hook-length control protein FliK n=1 Tax=Methylomonas sp. HYX-M1 TaxID=3139307 RepID=UPI00345BCD20